MDKKTSIVLLVIGVVIIALIALAFGLETQTKQFTSDDVLRINNEMYKKAEFENYIKYNLYNNEGSKEYDEAAHANHNHDFTGASEEDIFMNICIEEFSFMKMYGLLAKDKKITLSDDDKKRIDEDFEANSKEILAYGLTKEAYIDIATQQAIMEKVSMSPDEYIDSSDEIYNSIIEQFSGDDLKSYTYRIIQVNYEEDTESGESGEIVPGNRAEKEAYINTLVARINSGESFETVGESGDNRLILAGTNGYNFGKCNQEYAAGFLLKDKVGEDLYAAMKKIKAGEITEVVESGTMFQIATIEKIEDGIVGEAKKEVSQIIISQYQDDLVYTEYVKDMEVNQSAISRIEIK